MAELLEAGHAGHRPASKRQPRPRAEVENLTADRNDAQVRRKRALPGRRFDVVFDNVYDWERGTTAAQVEATVRAVGDGHFERYIFMSSVAAYGDGLNHSAKTPWRRTTIRTRTSATRP